MRLYWNLLAALALLCCTTSGLSPPSSYYQRSYYSAVAPPEAARFTRRAVPSFVRGDLLTNESKKYAKKAQYRPYASEEDDYSGERYNSGEYSSESSQHSYNSREQDSREYTIGTQIRVQHPIPVPKRGSSSSPYAKPHKYVSAAQYKSPSGYAGDTNSASAEEPEIVSVKRPKYTQVHYQPPDPFHVVPPPKASLSSLTNNRYSVFEPVNEDYDVSHSTLTRTKPHDRYKGVASKKQIEAFLDDQQKLLDEAIKLQLINNPKLQKYLKSKVNNAPRHELDSEDFETYPPNFSAPGPLRGSYNSNEHLLPVKPTRPHRRPPGVELKRSPKPKLIIKPKRKYRSALVINV